MTTIRIKPVSTRSYMSGAFWIILGCLASNINDILMKYMGAEIKTSEIIFFRFFLSALLLLPFMLQKPKINFKIHNYNLHLQRIIFGALAVSLACYSTSIIPLADVTALSFTQPLFFLPLAVVFLNERFDYKRLFATVLGFVGVMFIVNPGNIGSSLVYLAPISAAILFAFMDLATKKLMFQQRYLAISFYFALGAAIICLIPTLLVWKIPSTKEILLLIVLGLSSNIIQLCVCKSFDCAEIISLAPFRYVEIVFSAIFGMLIFNETPKFNMLIGVTFIIYSALWLAYKEVRQQRQPNFV